MANVVSGSVVRQIKSLFDGGSMAGLSDRQLLERYIADAREPCGEAAFAALVSRHGPMVMSVCRQLLSDAHHAEDAFQAVFLVLARRARSIRDPDLLGNWLYGVAIRTARCARQQIVRRRRREEGVANRGSGLGLGNLAEPPTSPPADQPAIDREQAEAIHGEIDRLPRAFRLPVALCYFEGLTLDEAARRLRCPQGTLRSRLARARQKLKISLARRGIALPAAALGAALAPRSASAAISPVLCDSVVRTACQLAARLAASGSASASATALAREVLRSMLIHKLKFVALFTLFLGAVGTGVGLLARSPAANDEPKRPRVAHQPPAAIVGKPDIAAPGRMFVTGRVLDSAGKPAAGVAIDIVGRPRGTLVATSLDGDRYRLLGLGSTDHDGRFRLDASRTSENRFFEVFALAAAPGFGLGWFRLNTDAERL